MDPISAAQMRKIEQDAITSGRVTGLELMERAGQGVVEAVFEEWPDLEVADWGTSPRRPLVARTNGASMDDPPEYLDQKENRKAVVLCGPGNNGGDGFVVARLLAERGWAVDVFFYGTAEKLPQDAREMHDQCAAILPVMPLSDTMAVDVAAQISNGATLCMDALFGIGLSRPFTALTPIRRVLQRAYTTPVTYVLAIDIPSGLCAETGVYLDDPDTGDAGPPLTADLTVTFHAPKHGHLRARGPAACGKLVVKDIGL